MNNWVVEAVYLSMLMTTFCTGCTNDYFMIQDGINTLSTWLDGNILTFNASKCKYMIISRLKCNSVRAPVWWATWEGLPVQVPWSHNLSWSTHIDQISSRAHRITGLIYRQFYTWSSPYTLLQLYTSLVRPDLEYATQVWNPYLIKDIHKLESVQKFALKMCCKQWDLPYAATLELCSLPELKERTSHFSLFDFCKLVNDFPNCPYIYVNWS